MNNSHLLCFARCRQTLCDLQQGRLKLRVPSQDFSDIKLTAIFGICIPYMQEFKLVKIFRNFSVN